METSAGVSTSLWQLCVRYPQTQCLTLVWTFCAGGGRRRSVKSHRLLGRKEKLPRTLFASNRIKYSKYSKLKTFIGIEINIQIVSQIIYQTFHIYPWIAIQFSVWCSLCVRAAPGCQWAPGWPSWPSCPASARRSRSGAGWRTPSWASGQTTSAATASSQTTSTTPAQTSPSSSDHFYTRLLSIFKSLAQRTRK